jgi:hypothetical protein
MVKGVGEGAEKMGHLFVSQSEYYLRLILILSPPPPQNDAIGGVTNRYFPMTIESGRVPHGEDSNRQLRETNL